MLQISWGAPGRGTSDSGFRGTVAVSKEMHILLSKASIGKGERVGHLVGKTFLALFYFSFCVWAQHPQSETEGLPPSIPQSGCSQTSCFFQHQRYYLMNHLFGKHHPNDY